MRLVLCIAIALVSSARAAQAADLYSFFDEQCRRYTGLMARVSERDILLVDLHGQLVRLPRDRADALVVHQPLENPLSVLNVDVHLARHLRQVWVGEDALPAFTGWATSFYDDLFIFLDIDGKTHVLDPGDIARLERFQGTIGIHRPAIHAPVTLGFPPEIVPCSKSAPGTESLPPSQVIADRIKLGDYLGKLAERYQAFDGFEERTRVYAQPFVFDETSRVGLFYWQDTDLPIPFYFRWSNGRPYRFQSLTVVGNSTHEWLPFTEPSLSVRSDVKSHFFNATFVGNFLALPAGQDPFLLDSLDDILSGNMVVEPRVDVDYNYLIMMGADYWRFSASAGPAYLATRVRAPGPTPDSGAFADIVRAERLSPSGRLLYQGPGLALRLLYFNTRISGELSNDVIIEDLQGVEVEGTFKLRNDIVRAGATVRIIDEIELSLDEIVTIGRYEAESMMIAAGMNYAHSETAVMVSAEFGRYVTVRGYGRLFARRYEIDGQSATTRFERAFGGGLEFVF